MAIIDNRETESANSSGFTKGIEASAMSMMLDNLQVFMYQKPIQSTVRECTSNALDAIKEKKIAIEILTDKAKVSDYFVEKEGDIYKDSRFDHSYYDLKWLNDVNKVTLTYVNSDEALGRDQFIIEDTGVGLGGVRLEKYFSLGYSSKRLTSQTLGAFGLGNKSPLSTGVESYRVVSRYNGMEFAFDVYSHKVDCVYGKFNEDGTMNDFYQFASQDFKAYYKATDKKNGVTIYVDVKKHNKHQFFEAVKSQLMYFKENIEFLETTKGITNMTNITFKSNILFEDDDIILSDSNYFGRPHFVLKNVSYGAVDFRELELENRHGSIGIKVNMEEVDVSPSRETIIYNQRTKAVILSKYNRITDTVTNMVNASLNSEDFIDWVRACNNIFYGGKGNDRSSIVYKLSGMIDKFNLDLKHPSIPGLKYYSDLPTFTPKGLKFEQVSNEYRRDYKTNKTKALLRRTAASNMSSFNSPVFLQFKQIANKTSRYVLDQNPDGFLVVKANLGSADYLEEILTDYLYKKVTYQDAIQVAKTQLAANLGTGDKYSDYLASFVKCINFLQLLTSSRHVALIDDNVVPGDYTYVEETDGAVEVDLAKQAKDEYKKLLQQRKAQGKFIIARCADRSTAYTTKYVYSNVEVETSALTSTDTIVYGYNKDVELLTFISRLISGKHGTQTVSGDTILGWTDNLKVCRIAQNNKKYLLDRTFVDDFIVNVEDRVLTTHPLLKEYMTINYLRKNLVESEFFTNFALFSKSLESTYTNLITTSRSFKTHSLPKDCQSIELIKNAVKYQTFKFEHPDADQDLIYKKGVELLGEDLMKDIDDVDIIDRETYDSIIWLNKFSEVFGSMFNHLTCLRTKTNKISDQTERDIRAFIAIKKDELELDYPDLNY